MQPAAHIETAIECLSQLFESWHEGNALPADKHFHTYTKNRRYIGSKDRIAVAELYYSCLRYLAMLDDIAIGAPSYEPALPYPCPTKKAPLTARYIVLAKLVAFHDVAINELKKLCSGETHQPAKINEAEYAWLQKIKDRFDEAPVDPTTEYWLKRNTSDWLREMMFDNFGKSAITELAALQQEAPVDIRTNYLKTTRDELQDLLEKEGVETITTPLSPIGLRLQKRTPIFNTSAFREGLFEMQDEGSQIAACLVDAAPKMKVIDFCAGAGGKTLAIAAQMQNKGRILALDTSAKRLKDLPLRIRRAGVDNTTWKTITSEQDSFLKRHKLSADRVLVDAPCSGSGTWRRNPDLKWRLTEKDVKDLMQKQLSILTSASRLVKQGGRLIYVTCSLLKNENETTVKHFLESNANFKVVCAKKIWNKEATDVSDASPSYLVLTPGQDGTDGFFAAVMERQG